MALNGEELCLCFRISQLIPYAIPQAPGVGLGGRAAIARLAAFGARDHCE